jgi:arylsulfatase A-like enzyme
VYLPERFKTLPTLLKAEGYFTFNVGKTDYNFVEADGGLYSSIPKNQTQTPWKVRAKGQPFFGQIQLKGGKSSTAKWPATKRTDPATVTVPADYPQTKLYREVVAQHHDTLRLEDGVIGGILDRLKADGLMDSTIVVYFSDHGANNLVRHKQMPTEGGLHVPFIVLGPKKWVPTPGTVRNDLIDTLDLSATTLAWAGVPLPEWCEGQDLFAKDFTPREFVPGAKDRLDHTIDRVRTIRTDRFRYTRNYKLDRIFLQPQYRDGKDYVKALRAGYADGSLDPTLAEIYFGERPAEELYDVSKDPAQVNNLVNDPAFAKELDRHRKILADWLAKGDEGIGEEPDEEMVMNGNGRFHGVNPEYERVRSDSDGDGLSDLWEKYNDRDPEDGKLLFTFECGGWQTEGWESEGKTTNIAGRQGYLDFDAIDGKAALTRAGLNLDAAKNAGSLQIIMRSLAPTKVSLSANGKALPTQAFAGGKTFTACSIPLDEKVWSGQIKDLKLAFDTRAGTTIEIDAIEVVR